MSSTRQNLKVCFIGYLTYIGLNSISFVIDALNGQGGSGKIFSKFWLPILILSSILVLIGTVGYLLKMFPSMNKVVLIILSILATSLQVVVAVFIFFFFAMIVLAPILGRLGFYITMP